MNIRKLLAPLSALGLCVGAGGGVAHAKALDGWGPYKFGMSSDQVISAAKGDIYQSLLYGSNSLETDVKMGPYDGQGIFFFSQVGGRLVRIMVDAIGSTKDCKDSRAYFLRGLTKKYGPPVPDKYGGYDWKFQNRYMISLTTGDHNCAVVDYFPRPVPPPKAGF